MAAAAKGAALDSGEAGQSSCHLTELVLVVERELEHLAYARRSVLEFEHWLGLLGGSCCRGSGWDSLSCRCSGRKPKGPLRLSASCSGCRRHLDRRCHLVGFASL